MIIAIIAVTVISILVILPLIVLKQKANTQPMLRDMQPILLLTRVLDRDDLVPMIPLPLREEIEEYLKSTGTKFKSQKELTK